MQAVFDIGIPIWSKLIWACPKARISGVECMIITFDFLFCCNLGEYLLKQMYNLSRTLHNVTISAAEGYVIAKDVIQILLNDQQESRIM